MIYCELCIYNDSFKKNISYLLHKLITLDNNSISCPNRYEFCRRNTTTRISSRRISSSNYYSYYYSASSSYWRNDLRGLAGLYRLSRLILLDIQSMLQWDSQYEAWTYNGHIVKLCERTTVLRDRPCLREAIGILERFELHKISSVYQLVSFLLTLIAISCILRYVQWKYLFSFLSAIFFPDYCEHNWFKRNFLWLDIIINSICRFLSSCIMWRATKKYTIDSRESGIRTRPRFLVQPCYWPYATQTR